MRSQERSERGLRFVVRVDEGEYRKFAFEPERKPIGERQVGINARAAKVPASLPMRVEEPRVEEHKHVVERHQPRLDGRRLMLPAIAAFGLADGGVKRLVAEMDHDPVPGESMHLRVPLFEQFRDQHRGSLPPFDADEVIELAGHEVATVKRDEHGNAASWRV
jgi:hypothetical protein